VEAYDLDQLAADITGLADHFGDLRSPLGEVRRDLEGDPRTLHAPQLPAFGEQRSDDSGNPPTWPPKTRGSTSAWRSSARSSMSNDF